METMRIENVEGKRSRNGKLFYAIEMEDGRKFTSFDSKFASLSGAVIGFEVVRNGEFKNINLKEVVSYPDKASSTAIMSSSTDNKDVSIKPKVNPAIVYMAACNMVAPLVNACLIEGDDWETTQGKIKANFSNIYNLAYSLYESHIVLNEMKELSKELF